MLNLFQSYDSKIKFCSRNSIIGINKAWGLKDIDSGMCYFRAITAEEEISSGIIHALQEREYAGANYLNPKKHQHKTAILSFFQVITHAFQFFHGYIDAKITIGTPQGEKGPRPRIALRLLKPNIDNLFYPEPPLNFSFSQMAGDGKELRKFQPQIEHYLEINGKKDYQKYLTQRANIRNIILYSSREGISNVKGDTKNLVISYFKNILRLNVICMLIYHYTEPQIFVQESLDALLSYALDKNKNLFRLP